MKSEESLEAKVVLQYRRCCENDSFLDVQDADGNRQICPFPNRQLVIRCL